MVRDVIPGNATVGTLLSAASPRITVACATPGAPECPSADVMSWYEVRMRRDGVAGGAIFMVTVHVTGVGDGNTDARARRLPGPPRPQPGEDESYVLECSAGVAIPPNDNRRTATTRSSMDPVDAPAAATCTVTSPHLVGALRGLETMAHLAHARAVPLPLRVSDTPRFPYRGNLAYPRESLIDTTIFTEVMLKTIHVLVVLLQRKT